LLRFQPLAADDEMKMDSGEYLGIRVSALGLDLYYAVGNRRAAFFQYVHDVVRRARAGADEHRFHRARTEIASAAFRRPIHDYRVAAAGFSHEACVLDPLDARFHPRLVPEKQGANDTRSTAGSAFDRLLSFAI
jgi:hypothetical protein